MKSSKISVGRKHRFSIIASSDVMKAEVVSETEKIIHYEDGSKITIKVSIRKHRS